MKSPALESMPIDFEEKNRHSSFLKITMTSCEMSSHKLLIGGGHQKIPKKSRLKQENPKNSALLTAEQYIGVNLKCAHNFYLCPDINRLNADSRGSVETER